MSKNLNKILTKKYLKYNYIDLNKSAKKISKELCCSATTITKYLRLYKFNIKTNRESQPCLLNIEYEILNSLYTEKKKTIKEIALMYNTSDMTIYNKLLLFKIRVRKLSEIPRKIGNQSKLWKGYGEISSQDWHRIKLSAIKRNILFKITIEEIWELFLRQNRKCAYTNEVLVFSKISKESTASLDRIDSSKDYTLDNVQWVHKDINKMKGSLPEERFLEICKKITKEKHEKQTYSCKR